MAERIPQSTAYELAFKAFNSSTGLEATSVTIAITISKDNATSFSNPSGGATNATEIGFGWYFVGLTTSDTGTLGRLAVRGTSATINDVGVLLTVVSAATGGATNLDATISSRMATYTQPTGFLSATFPSGTIANTTNLTAGTIATVTNRVTANTDQLAGQTVTAAAGVTFPTDVASPTNITAGTITTVSGNVTGSVGSVVAGVTLAVGAVQAIWDALTSAFTTVGSIGKRLADDIDATISSRLASGSYTTPPTANQNADALLDRTDGIETGITPRMGFRGWSAALLGKLSGAATTNVLIRDPNDTKNVVDATVDASGNRTAVTLDLT